MVERLMIALVPYQPGSELAAGRGRTFQGQQLQAASAGHEESVNSDHPPVLTLIDLSEVRRPRRSFSLDFSDSLSPTEYSLVGADATIQLVKSTLDIEHLNLDNVLKSTIFTCSEFQASIYDSFAKDVRS